MPRVAAVTLAAICAVVAVCPAAVGAADRAEADRHDLATTGSAGEQERGLQATLQRSTLFETQRALLLTVRNGGDEELHIGAIQLSSPLFEPIPPQVRDALLRASGRGVAMPLPFGTAVCDGEAEAPPELVTDVDGEEVRVPLDEMPSSVLADLHDAECAAAAVLADVDLRLGDTWDRTAPRTVVGEVEVVQRHRGVTAAVNEVLGNVIFSVDEADEAGTWPEVDDDNPSVAIAVAIAAARCDPHALTEYKRTFIFTALVRVGDEEPVRVDIEADGEAHRALEEMLATCIE